MMIIEKVKYLASQYRQSENLKALLLSTLEHLEDSFLECKKIPNILDLKNAVGYELDIIGKIVGINRHYCGNFTDNLNYAMDTVASRNKISIKKIEEIDLSDECFRKLIEIKVIKNAKKIVNYKELGEILSYFFEEPIVIHTCGAFEIAINIKYANSELRKCLVLLRACLPLPPTIRLNFWEVMEFEMIEEIRIATHISQLSIVSVERMKLEELFEMDDGADIYMQSSQTSMIATEKMKLEELYSVDDGASIYTYFSQISSSILE